MAFTKEQTTALITLCEAQAVNEQCLRALDGEALRIRNHDSHNHTRFQQVYVLKEQYRQVAESINKDIVDILIARLS